MVGISSSLDDLHVADLQGKVTQRIVLENVSGKRIIVRNCLEQLSTLSLDGLERQLQPVNISFLLAQSHLQYQPMHHLLPSS